MFFHLPVFLSLLANLAGFIFTLRKVIATRTIDTHSKRSRQGNEEEDGGEKSSNFRLTHFCLKLDEKTKKDVVRDDIK